MGRYIYQGQFCDLSGNAVTDGTISVYLAGTTTLATIYTASTGGIADADSAVTSDSKGYFFFYVDEDDYIHTQKFKITLSNPKLAFLSKTYDNIQIFPDDVANVTTVAGDYTVKLSDRIIEHSGNGTVTFPAVATSTGIIYILKKTDAGTTTTISPNVDGVAMTVTTQNASLVISSDGATYKKIVAPANTAYSGLVELATDAETQTGTDTERAITPANLQACTATETRKGVAELATNAESETGTSTALVITPNDMAYTAQRGQQIYVSSSGPTTYNATLAPAIAAYVTGMQVNVKFSNGSTGASTLNLNTIGARKLYHEVSAAYSQMNNGDIFSGMEGTCIYDSTLDGGTGGFVVKRPKPVFVQRVYTSTGAVATGAVAIPYDDTIPQNAEGTQFLTLAITPTNASNLLDIMFKANVASNGGGNQFITVALFQDTTANSIGSAVETTTGQNLPLHISGEVRITAGTTAATTIKMRIGDHSGSTITLNGANSGRIGGGALVSALSITEVKL